MSWSISVKQSTEGIIIVIALIPWINLAMVDILTLLGLSTPEHDIGLHLFRSSLISLSSIL